MITDVSCFETAVQISTYLLPHEKIEHHEIITFSALFQRAVLSSGNALANWAFAADPVTKAEYFIRQMREKGYSISS